MSASSSDDSASSTWVQALTLGPEVYAFRNSRNPSGPHGRVMALLTDAIYFESDEGFVTCITRAERVAGPICMQVGRFDELRFAPGVVEGAEVTCTLHALAIGGSARVMWGYAEEWSPPLPHRIGALKARQTAIGRVEVFLARMQTERASQVAARIEATLKDFRQAIREDKYDLAANALCSLLGLGEGLTPEGDDVAMGVLASMVWWAQLGKLEARNVQLLAQVTRVFAMRTTNKISARLLWHAGDGLLYAPAMALGAALVAGEPDETIEPLQILLAVGNTTGRAVVTGLLAGMRLVAFQYAQIGRSASDLCIF